MKRNKGFTGVDIAVSVVIFTIFVTVIASMFYNLSVAENRIQRKTEATNLAIKVIETMKVIEFDKLTEGMTINDINNLITDKIEVPNGYNVTVGVDNSTYPDVIKIISVQIDYKSGKQDETINIETLVKKYTQIEITITYDANGGTGAPEAQKAYSDESITISTVEPTRGEYIFKGWSTSRNGEIQYKPGETISFNTDTRLYAVWAVKRKILIAFTNVTGSTVDRYRNEYFPKMIEKLDESSDYSYDINFVTGDEGLNLLESIKGGGANYDLVILHESVWDVPEIANDLALKYDLITIGNDSSEKINIIKSSEPLHYTAEAYPDGGLAQNVTQTDLGKQLINFNLDFGASYYDADLLRIDFADNVQVLYTATPYNLETSEVYQSGDGVGLLNNTTTGKMWIHSQINLLFADNHIEFLRILMEYILNNT